MASSAGVSAPPKPWERAGSSRPTPFRPPSANGSTAAVVESAGVANPADKNENPISQPPTVGRPMPARPWERNYGGGYGSVANYNQPSGYGSGSYGYGGYGSSYGGAYGNNYRGNYGVGSYGGLYGGSYGLGNSYGGPYGGGYGYGNMYGPMGSSYGMGAGGAFDYGQGNPNNPFGEGPPAGPPSFWQAMLRVMHGVVNFFGRISILVDQNTQAFHFFITALLQLFDRTGVLYGELARFVLRLLGFRTGKRVHPKAGGRELPSIEGPKEGGGAWDNLWFEDNSKKAAE
eukprot:c26382_g2_i1 orf=732-1595(-)